jgi:hypothetical protein
MPLIEKKFPEPESKDIFMHLWPTYYTLEICVYFLSHNFPLISLDFRESVPFILPILSTKLLYSLKKNKIETKSQIVIQESLFVKD